jgi:amino acid adenylation domain-containing protein
MRVADRERVAAYLAERDGAARGGITPRPGGATAPLSFPQQQLWLHAQLAPDLPLYNEPVTIHYAGRLDVGALERSLAEIIRRHSAWRTSFSVVDGELRQVIHSPPVLALPTVDLRHLPRASREGEALRIATEDALRPFDLERGPLVRATLVRLADDEHRLFLTLHHIIFDGVALYRVFLPELATLYEAFAAGRPSPLAEPPVQYTDFARWQRESQPGSETWTGQLAYWRRSLAGAPMLALPTDRPRPAVQTFRGAMETLAFSKTTTEALRALSAGERATLYMTMLAAFTTLLHRYSGQEDLVVGTVTAGRKRPELEQLLGYFLNPLALRIECSADPTFRQLLARVRDVALDALANDDVPFEHVVNEVQPQRERDRNPLFQVLFSLEPPLPPLPPSWKLTQLDVETATAKFDLYLELDDRPEGMIGRFLYRTDLFEPATIARMVGHFHSLVNAIVGDPDRRLSALPLLTAAERRQLLVHCNDTATAYPGDATVHAVFETQVARAPDAVALVAGEETITYGELNARADRLARRLRALAVGPDILVGVCLERSIELVVAFLGILKAGGAYLPLDPSYPTDRLRFMVDDAQAAVVLTRATLRGLVGDAGAPVLLIDDDAIPSLPPAPPAAGAGPDHLAYVMFTSGSTGRPKGVAIQHRGILRLVFGQTYARLDATRTLLWTSAISFDVSTFELWGALLHGARCVLFPAAVPTPATLAALIRRHRVTTAWLTGSLFNIVIDEAPEALAGIEELLIGGEALSPSHVRRAYDHLPGVTIVNGYGPTECTTFACCHRLPGPPPPEAASVPIGRPIANTEVYVLDRNGNPVPIGVVGELYMGGAGLARGYVNRPELTAQRFVPHPFDATPGARLYRSGDLVRWRAEGLLEFLGRVDGQVKIRGFRIEPGEIEHVLASHPGVRDVAVVTRERAPGDRVLVAYVVPREPAPGPDVLREFLQIHLPAFMIPSAFVLAGTLPLTPVGKLDRAALTAAADGPMVGTGPRLAPRDPLEAQLVGVWEEVLGTAPVGVKDDFFALGGHSLTAVRLVQKIERLLDQALPLAAIHANPTVESLARVLLRRERGRFLTPALELQADGSKPPLFFFHGDLNGGGFYCRDLARHLGPDQPLIAIHPLGLDDRPVPATIEAMADEHLALIRRLQPRGPYLIGGYCNGGLTAYEVARRLAEEGEVVGPLVLIAAAADRRLRRLRPIIERLGRLARLAEDDAADYFGRLRYLADRLAVLGPWQRLRLLAVTTVGFVVEILAGLAGRRRSPFARTPIAPDAGTALRVADELLSHETFARYWTAVMAYVPRRFPGRLLVFWPDEERPRQPGAPLLGWDDVADHIEVIHVPGDHHTIVTRHTALIAQTVRNRLDPA